MSFSPIGFSDWSSTELTVVPRVPTAYPQVKIRVDRQDRAQSALHLHRAGACSSCIAQPGVILRTPTDIFPNINIPVIAVAWNYTGLNAEEMEGRITSVYERVLTTMVDNIEHIESTTCERPGHHQGLSAAERQPGHRRWPR